MGMSASQARLLSITSRINDIEFKSQQISNVKIRLADESEKVANAYTQALNKQKYTYTSYATGKAQSIDLTVNNLYKSGSNLQLVRRDGKQIVSKTVYNAFSAAANAATNTNSWANRAGCNDTGREHDTYYAFMHTIYGFNSVSAQFASYNLNWGDYSGNPYEVLVELGKLSKSDVDEKTALYESLKADAPKVATKTADGRDVEGFTTGNIMYFDEKTMNDPSWLYEAIESGEFMLLNTATEEEVSVSGNIQLQIVSDSTGLAKAEAEYNAATAKINTKEKKLDNELKSLDTEHNALKTEFDSVKSLIGDNVEKSFNLFS